MDIPATSNGNPTPDGAPTDERRRRRRFLAVLFLLLLLLALELLVGILRSPSRDPFGITRAFTGFVAGAGEPFDISGTVTAFPPCTTPAALLPGVERCLVYTVHNPRAEAITVTSISIQEVQGSPACPGDSLDVDRAAFAGALVVPAGATIVTAGLPISLRETAANQDGCRGTTFTFTFTGTARLGAASP